jgi:hypothetical protein
MTAKKTIIWFGNAGTPYGDFGLPNLRIVFPALRAVAQDVPLKLVCVSNDRAKFDEVTAGAGLECEFIPWSRDECMRQIEAADVFVAPNSLDRFSIVKSANRLVLSLSLGTPVVATSTPAAEALRPFVIFDDWEGGIRTYLTDSERVRTDVAAGRKFVSENFTAQRLAQNWAELLERAQTPIVEGKDVSAGSGDQENWLFALNDDQFAAAIDSLRNDAISRSSGETTILAVLFSVASRNPALLANVGASVSRVAILPDGPAAESCLPQTGAKARGTFFSSAQAGGQMVRDMWRRRGHVIVEAPANAVAPDPG